MPTHPHHLRTDFVAAFTDSMRQLGHDVAVFADGQEAAWRGADGRFNRAWLRQYSPSASRPDAPTTIRIVLMHGTNDVPAHVFAAVDLLRPRHHDGDDVFFELTCLPEELFAFAPWTAAWIAARDDAAEVVPPAPHPFDRPLPAQCRVAYAWTTAAMAAYRRWEAKFLDRRRR